MTLGYVAGEGAPSTRVVHPLGLATKGPRWYLVADTDTGMRTFRVDRVTSVEPTGEPVVRPDGFDLAESWRLIADEVDQLWAAVRARGTAAPGSVSLLRGILGNRLRIGPTREDGRVEVEIGGPSLRALAGSSPASARSSSSWSRPSCATSSPRSAPSSPRRTHPTNLRQQTLYRTRS